MSSEIIQTCKQYLNDNDLEGLQEYYRRLLNDESNEFEPDWPYIFHRVYLHACLKGRRDAADWLAKSVYPNMDELQRIALRQIFPYGRLLLSRAEKRN
jgi:hypothetical protein